jgi:hypothetical protein
MQFLLCYPVISPTVNTVGQSIKAGRLFIVELRTVFEAAGGNST